MPRISYPYRCIGSTIFALQSAGVTAGFISEPKRRVIEVSMAARDCRPTVDGKRVSFPRLRREAKRWSRTKPEIHLVPHPDARFECVDRVIAILKEADAGKLGFIGNERAIPQTE